jgi:ADP-heptose:LPS heptosyltransferase
VREGSIQAVTLIFPGALGDLLLALPTFRRLRRRGASARTTLVVTEPLRNIARLTGVAERVASLDDAGAAWLFGGSTLPAWLTDRPAVYAWLGAGDRALRDRLAVVSDAVHVLSVERGADGAHAAVAYARAAGVAATRHALAADARLHPPAPSRARALTAPLRRPLLAIHRGAGADAKRWAPQAFAAIAAAWRNARGDVVELLGPAEAHDEPLAGAVPVRDWSLPDVAGLLGLVDAYVGNDCGVSHLAGAVGARGVVVFRATDPRRWRPLTPTMVALRGRASEREPTPSPARVWRALAQVESLTSSHPGSSVRA